MYEVRNDDVMAAAITMMNGFNREVFRVTPEGRVFRGDEDITDNDAAILTVFREWVESISNRKRDG